jgi:hypothetical protein
MDHLGTQPHDEQHRLRVGVAKNLVTELDTVGAGDLRRLVGYYIHLGCSFISDAEWYCDEASMARFFAPQKALGAREGGKSTPAMLTASAQRYGMME